MPLRSRLTAAIHRIHIPYLPFSKILKCSTDTTSCVPEQGTEETNHPTTLIASSGKLQKLKPASVVGHVGVYRSGQHGVLATLEEEHDLTLMMDSMAMLPGPGLRDWTEQNYFAKASLSMKMLPKLPPHAVQKVPEPCNGTPERVETDDLGGENYFAEAGMSMKIRRQEEEGSRMFHLEPAGSGWPHHASGGHLPPDSSCISLDCAPPWIQKSRPHSIERNSVESTDAFAKRYSSEPKFLAYSPRSPVCVSSEYTPYRPPKNQEASDIDGADIMEGSQILDEGLGWKAREQRAYRFSTGGLPSVLQAPRPPPICSTSHMDGRNRVREGNIPFVLQAPQPPPKIFTTYKGGCEGDHNGNILSVLVPGLSTVAPSRPPGLDEANQN